MKNRTSLIIILIVCSVVLLNIMYPTPFGDLIINIGGFIAVLSRIVYEVISIVVYKNKKDSLELFNIILYLLLLYLFWERVW